MPRAIATVHIPPDFEKAFLRWFRNDAFDPRLRTHKLKAKLSEYWAYSVNREYRILFRFLNPHEVIYYDIGTHEIYR